MTRYAAFFRGINVGKAKRIAMADLRALVERLGYRDVGTILNSGNVVFTAPGSLKGDPGPRIEKAVASKLGVASRVTALTAAEVDAAIRGNTILKLAHDHARLLVAVLAEDADRKALLSLGRRDWAPEAFAHGTRAAYLWCPGGILESRLGKEFGATFRDAATTRNWTTMIKIQQALSPS